MPKWTPLPAEPFYHQPVQLEFLETRRQRLCKVCRQVYSVVPPVVDCPTCLVKGQRCFDRFTLIAGRRWGKSKVGSIAAVEEATIPNTIGWACAPSNPKLHRYVIPAFQELIPQSWVLNWSAEFNDLRLKNGSLIHFQTLEDPDQGRGQGLDWLWIDEVCELSPAHWDVIRPSLAGDTVAFFTTSPRGFDWVYKELYKPAESGVPGYWACHSKTSESANPRISDEFLAREKAQMSDTMYRQEYEADFVIFTGAVYGALIAPQVLRTSEEIEKLIPEWPNIAPWRPVIVGLDTGADHPFGAVKVVSTEGGLVVVGEYLERHKSFIQHAASLRWLAGSPTAKWAINKNERQPMIELSQHGINCIPAENDVVAGTERVKSWLHQKQLFFIESLCPITLEQMKAYRWAEDKANDGSIRQEKVYKLDDELPDCLRYIVMAWPTLPKVDINPFPQRDTSKLPIKMQQDIAAMRRIDGKQAEPASITGDFYV